MAWSRPVRKVQWDGPAAMQEAQGGGPKGMDGLRAILVVAVSWTSVGGVVGYGAPGAMEVVSRSPTTDQSSKDD